MAREIRGPNNAAHLGWEYGGGVVCFVLHEPGLLINTLSPGCDKSRRDFHRL